MVLNKPVHSGKLPLEHEREYAHLLGNTEYVSNKRADLINVLNRDSSPKNLGKRFLPDNLRRGRTLWSTSDAI